MDTEQLRVSVVVPARNASHTIERCLDAILAQITPTVEVIVVDDFSTDETFGVAARYPVQLLRMPRHSGPSAARNRGAEAARGELLFFVDSDTVLAPGAITRAVATMASRPELGALIGSYDADPAYPSGVSRFKNLAHHHFHQRSHSEASTFWGACGVIRRECFIAEGGFDENCFAVEDIELGYRLHEAGVRIALDPELQVKHLKRWTLRSMVVTDVTSRAIPWTLLWLQRGRLPNDLNFTTAQRIASAVSVALVMSIALAIVRPRAWLVVAGLLALALWLNRDLYRLLFRRGGVRLGVSGFFLQQLYYLYSWFALAVGLAYHLAGRFRAILGVSPSRTDPEPERGRPTQDSASLSSTVSGTSRAWVSPSDNSAAARTSAPDASKHPTNP